MSRKSKLLILFLILLVSIFGFAKYKLHPPIKELGVYEARVARVIDGDTILLVNGERVRYIGIDTPETKHPYKVVEYMGHEASEFNKKLVDGKTVRLEFDVERRDRYGRLLAYVYVDEVFVNAELVREGYAKIYTHPPNVRHADLFLKLQREARQAKRGLWAGKD